MSASEGFWHLLDPLRGDEAGRPDRVLRLNLRRVQLAAIAMVFDAAVEGIFSHFRNSPGLSILAIGAICGAIAFVVVARRGQRQEVPTPPYLPEAFVLYALVCSQAAGYFIASGGRITSGYAMVYLAGAAFFLISPRRYAMIGLGTFVLFNVWVFFCLDVIFFEKVVAFFNTGLAVLAGIFGRYALDRLQQVDCQQRARIAQQNEALVDTNHRLAARNAELNELMAIAAHDLRSPLFGLGNLLGLAATRPPSSPDGLGDLFREAHRSVAAMLVLVGRLLEAHEVEGHTAALERRDLHGTLVDAVHRMEVMATGYGIKLAVDQPPYAVQAVIDPGALDQILDNLISNALRFSPAGSTVRLSVGRSACPFIEVADEGIGIPANVRSQLFGKFRRGASRPLNGPRGYGLGLYIVRTLAGAMRAEVGYRPGQLRGSIFRVEFKA
ncbi:HAMP domain-containing sensor histidine kinase [Aquabacter sp. CN5-332]|uniref:sensor histidine kinase n=1 Tax=Aquabacter sp. CN5-332 TaxID=3156608 RepID=UPI0032B58E2E